MPLTVVVPSRSTRDMTVQCLSAVEAAAPTACQIVLVDDASEDDTLQVVGQRFPSVDVVRCDEPQGFTRAANAGVARAEGTVVLLLNSDTLVATDALTALLEVMEREHDYGVLGARLVYPDGSPQWSGGDEPYLLWLLFLASGAATRLNRSHLYRRWRSRRRAGSHRNASKPHRVEWVSGAAMAFRRDTWSAVGPLDEGYHFYCQDLDFCLRARKAGWKVGVVDSFRVVHHHGATIGRQPVTVARQNPALLWTDLARWARKSHGPFRGRLAVLALLFGAGLRVVSRAVGAFFVSGEKRQQWRHESLVYRRAMGMLLAQTARLNGVATGREGR